MDTKHINLVCLVYATGKKRQAFTKRVGVRRRLLSQIPPSCFSKTAVRSPDVIRRQRIFNDTVPSALAEGSFKGMAFAIKAKAQNDVDALTALAENRGTP
ncbi:MULTISPECIES: hypothetical protein [Pantoea]|uniref:hypothetical protein n=1 Tax=Pantoea TaxID=53335 RepID=UPI00050E96FB|nr:MULTISPECIES: hypothetical protein [Pantoea]KGD85452.1 hypothetical protein HA47_00945 [Pantoea stewartii subsp. indologenes]